VGNLTWPLSGLQANRESRFLRRWASMSDATIETLAELADKDEATARVYAEKWGSKLPFEP